MPGLFFENVLLLPFAIVYIVFFAVQTTLVFGQGGPAFRRAGVACWPAHSITSAAFCRSGTSIVTDNTRLPAIHWPDGSTTCWPVIRGTANYSTQIAFRIYTASCFTLCDRRLLPPPLNLQIIKKEHRGQSVARDCLPAWIF